MVDNSTLLAIDGLTQLEFSVKVEELATTAACRFRRGLVGSRPLKP